MLIGWKLTYGPQSVSGLDQKRARWVLSEISWFQSLLPLHRREAGGFSWRLPRARQAFGICAMQSDIQYRSTHGAHTVCVAEISAENRAVSLGFHLPVNIPINNLHSCALLLNHCLLTVFTNRHQFIFFSPILHRLHLLHTSSSSRFTSRLCACSLLFP